MDNELAQSSANIRDTTKWLIAAFAAIGAVLVAGLQLSDLGQLGTQQLVRLIASLIAAAAALICVGITILRAADVLTTRYTSLKQLALLHQSAVLAGQPVGLPTWAKDPVIAAIQTEWTGLCRGLAESLPGLYDLQAGLAEQKIVDQRAIDVSTAAQRIVDFANDFVTRQAFSRFKTNVIGSGAFIAVAIVAFAWLTHPPTSVDYSPTNPTFGELVLTSNGRTVFQSVVGPGCATKPILAVAIGGDSSDPEIELLPVRPCKIAPRSFHVPQAQGVFVPIPKTNLSTEHWIHPSDPRLRP